MKGDRSSVHQHWAMKAGNTEGGGEVLSSSIFAMDNPEELLNIELFNMD